MVSMFWITCNLSLEAMARKEVIDLNANPLYSQLGMQREYSRMERTLIRVSEFVKALLAICKGKQWKRGNVIAA
jgi:hypothetical protein